MSCQDFCYLGSTVTNDRDCDRDIEVRLGKANAAFARLGNIWVSKILSTEIKIRLYESLLLSIHLYCAETWSMKKTNEKKLEAAHPRWLRRILHISWKDMVSNEKARELTGQQLLGDIIRERRLRWCGHVWRMTTHSC